MMHTLACFAVIGLILGLPRPGHAYGRLRDPPDRGTMWSQGADTPGNYDNETMCGGFERLARNAYMCGVCGDPWDGQREHETGGKYATGQIARNYSSGQRINVQVQLTANHKGYFEFRLCPVNSPDVRASQECFDQNLLKLADGSGTKYQLTEEMGNVTMSIDVLLPPNLTCQQCVLQWRYHTGNRWGVDPNGTKCVGCGGQEEYYDCADIQIRHNYTGSGRSNSSNNGSYMACHGVGGRSDLDNWCQVNCGLGYCPANTCTCQPDKMVCHGVGGRTDLDNWCQMNCGHGYCPANTCACKVRSTGQAQQQNSAMLGAALLVCTLLF